MSVWGLYSSEVRGEAGQTEVAGGEWLVGGSAVSWVWDSNHDCVDMDRKEGQSHYCWMGWPRNSCCMSKDSHYCCYCRHSQFQVKGWVEVRMRYVGFESQVEHLKFEVPDAVAGTCKLRMDA